MRQTASVYNYNNKNSYFLSLQKKINLTKRLLWLNKVTVRLGDELGLVASLPFKVKSLRTVVSFLTAPHYIQFSLVFFKFVNSYLFFKFFCRKGIRVATNPVAPSFKISSFVNNIPRPQSFIPLIFSKITNRLTYSNIGRLPLPRPLPTRYLTAWNEYPELFNFSNVVSKLYTKAWLTSVTKRVKNQLPARPSLRLLKNTYIQKPPFGLEKFIPTVLYSSCPSLIVNNPRSLVIKVLFASNFRLETSTLLFNKTNLKFETSEYVLEHIKRTKKEKFKFVINKSKYAALYLTSVVNKFLEYFAQSRVLFSVNLDFYQFLHSSELVSLNRSILRLRLAGSQFSTIFFLSEFLDIIYLSFKQKNFIILTDYVQRILNKLIIWEHKRFLFFLFGVIKEQILPLFDQLNIKGLHVAIRGKIGVGGNSRKRNISLILGRTTATEIYTSTASLNRLLVTSTGALGIKFNLFYSNA